MRDMWTVELSTVGNPDWGQDPERPLHGADPNVERVIISLAEAQRYCREYIDRNNLGSGNFSGGAIRYNGGEPVAYVSYNGRIWLSANCGAPDQPAIDVTTPLHEVLRLAGKP